MLPAAGSQVISVQKMIGNDYLSTIECFIVMKVWNFKRKEIASRFRFSGYKVTWCGAQCNGMMLPSDEVAA